MAGYRATVGRLSTAQKPGVGVPPYTRYVNRPLGRRLAALGYLLGLTPNQVTALSMACSLAGLVLLVLVAPAPALGLAVGGALLLGYALDSADGQLARLRGEGGPAGEWVDHVSDQARQGAVHAATLVALYRFAPDVPRGLLLVPLGYGIVSATRFLSQILAEQMRRAAANEQTPRAAADGQTSPRGGADSANRRAWLNLPVDAGVLCLAFLLAGMPIPFLVAYTTLGVLTTASTAQSLRRRYRELRALTLPAALVLQDGRLEGAPGQPGHP